MHISASAAWRLLSIALTPKNEDAEFWWNATGPLFALMLFEAGYSISDQLHHLAFHFNFIIEAFGPRPSQDGYPQTWNSFMTDDFSPIEFSWCWDGLKPKVRYSIEAISNTSGTAKDPYNREPALRLITRLKKSFTNIDWTILEECLDLFDLSDKRASFCRNSSSSTTLGLAFEFGIDGRLEAKAYLAPPKPPMLHSNVYSNVVKFAENTRYRSLDSARALFDYSSSTTTGRSLALIGLALDCIKPEHSRIKVYARSKKATIEAAKEILTLGSLLTPEYLDNVENLWRCLFEKNVSSFCKDHETVGLLYLFDISTAKAPPSAKIYFPIRHYSRTDQDACQGLGNFLKSIGHNTSWLGSYNRVVQSFERSRGFSLGSQTYVSLGHKHGKVSLTSYLSPQIYRQQ